MARLKRYYFLLIITFFLMLFGLIRGLWLRDKLYLNATLLESISGSNKEMLKNDSLSEIEKRSPSLIWQHGYFLWQDGQQEEALSVWQQVPQYSAAILLAKIKASQDVKYQMLQTALLLDPYSDEVSEYASFYLLQRGENTLAYHLFYRVYQQNPNNAVAMMTLVLTEPSYLRKSDNDTLDLFDKAIAIAPENIYVIRYGFRVMNKFDIGESRILQLIRVAKAQSSHDFEILFSLANAYNRLGDYLSAEQYNLRALDINPNHPWANLQLVENRQIQGKSDIQPWLNRAIKFRVQSRPDYYKRLIAVLLVSNDVVTAKEIFCEAIENGYSPQTFRNLTETAIDEVIFSDCSVLD